MTKPDPWRIDWCPPLTADPPDIDDHHAAWLAAALADPPATVVAPSLCFERLDAVMSGAGASPAAFHAWGWRR